MIVETRHTDFVCTRLQKTVRIVQNRNQTTESDSGQRAVVSDKWNAADCSGKLECRQWAQTGCPLFP